MMEFETVGDLVDYLLTLPRNQGISNSYTGPLRVAEGGEAYGGDLVFEPEEAFDAFTF